MSKRDDYDGTDYMDHEQEDDDDVLETSIPGPHTQANKPEQKREAVEGNPFVLKKARPADKTDPGEQNVVLQKTEDDEPVVDDDEAQSKRRDESKVKFAVAIAACVIFALGIVGFLAYRANVRRLEYKSVSRKIKSANKDQAQTNKQANQDEDTRKRQAIEEAKNSIGPDIPGESGNNAVGTNPQTGQDQSNRSNQSNGGIASNPTGATQTTGTSVFQTTDFGRPTLPANPSSSAGDVKQNNENDADKNRGGSGSYRSSSSGGSSQSRQIKSQRNKEESIYISEIAEPKSNRVATYNTADYSTRKDGKNAYRLVPDKPVTPSPVIPAFGSMLPVRTLGTLYTLRSGSFVRMELVRDVKGDGWALKRGTMLVGANKGSDYDRAFVSVVGFIDPQTGKLVHMNGDVMGGDGANGLRGKRHVIGGGWNKVLSGLISPAANIAGSLISGRSKDTVIISDGFTTKAINPVANEISGAIDHEVQKRQQKGFVEVYAGTPGYIMVTDLPTEIKGIDAIPENEDQLSMVADVNRTRAATGLSEKEFAELIQSGSHEDIKEAMPKMTPAMREIAFSALKEE